MIESNWVFNQSTSLDLPYIQRDYLGESITEHFLGDITLIFHMPPIWINKFTSHNTLSFHFDFILEEILAFILKRWIHTDNRVPWQYWLNENMLNSELKHLLKYK